MVFVNQYHAEQEELIGILRGVLLANDPQWVSEAATKKKLLDNHFYKIRNQLTPSYLEGQLGTLGDMKQAENDLYHSAFLAIHSRPEGTITEAQIKAYLGLLDKFVRPKRRLTQKLMNQLVVNLQNTVFSEEMRASQNIQSVSRGSLWAIAVVAFFSIYLALRLNRKFIRLIDTTRRSLQRKEASLQFLLSNQGKRPG